MFGKSTFHMKTSWWFQPLGDSSSVSSPWKSSPGKLRVQSLVGDNPHWLVGGWTNPFEKYARQNGDLIFPSFRGGKFSKICEFEATTDRKMTHWWHTFIKLSWNIPVQGKPLQKRKKRQTSTGKLFKSCREKQQNIFPTVDGSEILNSQPTWDRFNKTL